MTLSVDLFWSFRSPYSYLALPILHRHLDRYDFTVNARPVYPLAVRDPTFFKRVNPQFAPYVMRDAKRIAEFENIPFHFPRPDPIAQDMTTLQVAAEQPRIERLTRLGAAAQEAGQGLAFIMEVSAVLFSPDVVGWDAGEHLVRAAERAGCDLAELDARIAAHPDRYDDIIAGNERDHAASGHWGVPTFVFEGEPFFGQDRIEMLVWRMKERGLRAR